MTIRLRLSQDTGAKFTHNNDPYYDSLVDQFHTMASMDKAKEIYVEADKYSITQHWAVQTFPAITPVAWQPYVKGYSGQLILGHLGRDTTHPG